MTDETPLQPLEKARRKGGPRSRAGCSNCKQRRVKCDETRPKCQRCIKRGLDCQGMQLQDSPLASLHKAATCRTISSYAIPFRVPGSQHERQLLHYFCVKGATDLSGYLISDFWTRIVLRRSQEVVVVRQAVVALASLHQEDGMGSDSSGVLYNKAMRSMRKYLSHRQRRLQQSFDTDRKGDNEGARGVSARDTPSNQACRSGEIDEMTSTEPSMVAPLICCALFYSYESIQGNVDAAMKHLAAGLNILDGERAKFNSLRGEDSDDLRDLEDLFSRLDLQAGIYDETTYAKLHAQRMPSNVDSSIKVPQASMTAESMIAASQLCLDQPGHETVQPFGSMNEAQRCLTHLQTRTTQWMRASIQYRYLPWETIPPQANLDLVVLTNEYAVWGWRFLQYFTLPSDDIPHHPLLHLWEDHRIQESDYPASIATKIRSVMEQRREPGIGMLYIHYYMFYLILTSALPDDPAVYTRLTAPDFVQCPIEIVLGMVESMLAMEDTAHREIHNPKRRISAETGLVATVFLMVTRSDNYSTVKRALGILERSRRREGLYDARVVSALTKRVMEMHGVEEGEEDGPGQWDPEYDFGVHQSAGLWREDRVQMGMPSQQSRMSMGKWFTDSCTMGGGFEGMAKALGVAL